MIVIVGGGCSGVLVAANLLRLCADTKIVIVEPRSELGRGVAYSTPWREHRLNAPAGQMSAFASKPTHFVEWLDRRDWPGGGDGAFVPRQLYGTYLQDVLADAIAETKGRGQVTHLRAEVVDVDVNASGAALTLSNGSALRASFAVLALGNARPAPLEGVPVDERIFPSAWPREALRLTSVNERVLLIGSGLTAIDAMLAFESQRHVGALHLVSRRGRVPQAHRDERVVPQSPAVAPPASLRAAYRAARTQIRSTRDWREVIDGLRPVTNGVWEAWTPDDRARFRRHVKVYWDSHRHRMAPEIGAALERCLQSGRLIVHAGRLRDVSPSSSGLDVTIAGRTGAPIAFQVDRVINCTGIEEKYETSRRPIVRELLAKGVACANRMGTGFRTTTDGALMDREGRASGRLFTIGPPRYGDLLETIAVGEIRAQAARLAELIAGAGGGEADSDLDAQLASKDAEI